MKRLILCIAVLFVASPAVAAPLDAGSTLVEPFDASAPEASAVAPAAAEPTDPIVTAGSTTETAWDLVEQHGPIWGGMLLLFGLVSTFLKRNASAGWLAQGRTLAIVVGLTGVLGSVLEAGVNGGTWAGVIVTLVAAVKLLLFPTQAAPKVT